MITIDESKWKYLRSNPDEEVNAVRTETAELDGLGAPPDTVRCQPASRKCSFET
jgi:hypothetical protein